MRYATKIRALEAKKRVGEVAGRDEREEKIEEEKDVEERRAGR